MSSTPPRLFRALLRRALPKDMRDSTVADLQEMYAKRVQSDGAFRAGLWYRLQAITFVARFAFERPKFSLIDWKLGFRMLIKYPGLSVVSGLALMTAIGFGTTFTHVLMETANPDVGLEDGGRVVRMDRFEVADQTPMPITVMELGIWREKATQLVDIGAYRMSQRNLTDPGRTGALIEKTVGVAEITPSGFDLARVRPLLGRGLTEEDARPDAQKAVVIGYEVWQNQMAADPRVLGREVGLGREVYSVVGVMPEGFEFPNRRFTEVWVPLQTGNLLPATTLSTFARLAPSASFASAIAELEGIGREAAAVIDREAGLASGTPGLATSTHPRVIGFAKPDPSDFPLIAFIFPILLIVVSIVVAAANAATLVFARTAMREGEIVVRTAMGASRGRIVGQLFAEAMVLSGAAGVLGLVGAQFFIKYMSVSFGNDGIIDATFDPITIIATGGFAVLAAAVIGFLPALKATGTKVQEGIKNVGGGGTNLGFGGVWSVIIVLQVAITVAALPFGVDFARSAMVGREIRSRFPAESFLSFYLVIDPPEPAQSGTPGSTDAALDEELERARISEVYAEVERRVASEPGVEGVAFASTVPGIEPPDPNFETESKTFEAQDARVGVGYLDLFDVPLVAGRALNGGDVDAANNPVVVNEAFARALGGPVVGARVRHEPYGPDQDAVEWLEIVGVVKDMNLEPGEMGEESPFVFTPIAPAEATPLRVAVKTQGEPAAMMNRMRDIVREVDPTIRVYDLLPLEQVIEDRDAFSMLVSRGGIAGILLCMLLSAAGLFALMAVGVARRTREVGIRLALGADRLEVLMSLFGRAGKQLALGVVVGLAGVVAISFKYPGMLGRLMLPLASVAFAMALVGVIAVVVPARRALRITPVIALKE